MQNKIKFMTNKTKNNDGLASCQNNINDELSNGNKQLRQSKMFISKPSDVSMSSSNWTFANNIEYESRLIEQWIKSLENEADDVRDEFVRTICPKRFIAPKNYPTPKAFAYAIFNTFQNPKATVGEDAESVKKISLQEFAKLESPTYFLDEGFFEMVNRTDLDDSFTFSQLHFPMNSFLLVLSNNSSMQMNEGGFQFCLVTKYKNSLFILIVGAATIARSNGTHYEEPFVQSSWIIMDGNIKSTCESFKSTKPQDPTQEYMEALQQSGISIDWSQSQIDIATEFVLKLLLIISTQPSVFVELDNGIAIRKERRRSNGSLKKEALWNPLWIGKPHIKYIDSADGSGAGSKKTRHFRRGHLRNQRYGVGRRFIRLIWIQPQVINAEEMALEE